MANFVENYCELPTALRRPMWRLWHNLLIRIDKDVKAIFMNYGYAGLNGDKAIKLEKDDEINRYSIQLYDHVVRKVNLENKKVLEVGSGRGGGAYYISRYYKPQKYTGLDISSGVIKFCNNHYNFPGLSFVQGVAEKIPFKNGSYDVVVNVESARCYRDIEGFFKGVHRVLVDNGHFLFADMIEKEEVKDIRNKLQACGFKIISENEITKNVSKGLDMDANRRKEIVKKRAPKFLQKSFKSFAGIEGTKRYESFTNGKFEYWSFVLSKN